MSVFTDAKQDALRALKAAIGKEYSPTLADLTTPPDTRMGDVAFPCFALAKGMKRPPHEIAAELATKIASTGLVKKAEAAGPYVNLRFDTQVLGERVLKEVKEEGNAYGTSEGGKGKRVLIEFANPNTHKYAHIGHLRNLFLGQALIDTLRATGHEVIPVSYINDMGANVAACLWGVKYGGEPKQEEEDDLGYLNRMYVLATARMKEEPEVKAAISQIQRDLEVMKGPEVKLWKTTRNQSLKALKTLFKELGLTIDKYYLESELIHDTKDIVESLKKKGIAVMSEGAWIVNLEDEGLGANLLVKSDGTLLYNAKDIALAYKKEADFHPPRSLYVVDARQSLALKQLFATLKRMGFDRELEHISYEFVTLKEGAMSSRKGNVIRYETFRDELIAAAVEQTRSRHEDWSEHDVTTTASAVAYAAMRFAMLKQDPDKKIVFDQQEAMSFDGFTGPYLLYMHTRTASMLAKAGKKGVAGAMSFTNPIEHQLLVALAQYPDVVSKTASEGKPNILAQYLCDMAATFSSYYEAVPLLSSTGAERVARVRTVQAVQTVLKNGLTLLGIKTVKHM